MSLVNLQLSLSSMLLLPLHVCRANHSRLWFEAITESPPVVARSKRSKRVISRRATVRRRVDIDMVQREATIVRRLTAQRVRKRLRKMERRTKVTGRRHLKGISSERSKLALKGKGHAFRYSWRRHSIESLRMRWQKIACRRQIGTRSLCQGKSM